MFVIACQNFVSNAIMKDLLEMKHAKKYACKTKIETKFSLKGRSHANHVNMCSLIVTVISNACIYL